VRKDDLLKVVDNNAEYVKLIDEIVYLEEQLDVLRELPKIKINPDNPEMQKATPAAKMYKEYLQQYLNAVKLLSKAAKIDADEDESPLRAWIRSRTEKG